MLFATALLALLASPVLASPLGSRATTAKPNRAIWLWTSDLIKDSGSLSTFFSTVKDSNSAISTVHALVDRDMGTEVWSNFVSKCNASGISVQALMGDGQWILGETTDNGPTLQHELDWVKKYQASVPANAKFSAIHLDIEPWGLDAWSSNKAKYISSLLQIVDTVKSTAQSLGMPVAVDLPFWSNTISCENTTLDICMLKKVDSATFMTYRNTAPELLAIGTPLLTSAALHNPGKQVWLSVETSANCADVELISYAGKSVQSMLNDLSIVDKTAKSVSAFAGISIHSYKEFLDLSRS